MSQRSTVKIRRQKTVEQRIDTITVTACHVLAQSTFLNEPTSLQYGRGGGVSDLYERARVNGHRFLPKYGHRFSPPAAIFSPHWWP